jgi:hypothetical protein
VATVVWRPCFAAAFAYLVANWSLARSNIRKNVSDGLRYLEPAHKCRTAFVPSIRRRITGKQHLTDEAKFLNRPVASWPVEYEDEVVTRGTTPGRSAMSSGC